MRVKSKYLIFMMILCILLSMSAVSAIDDSADIIRKDSESVVEAHDICQSAGDEDYNVLAEESDKSYDDLCKELDNATGTFDMKSNYKYNVNDGNNSLHIYSDDLVINGNNHYIDGSEVASGLSFDKTNATITINNLKLINLNGTALSISDCNITLNNVTFIKNYNSDGQILDLGVNTNATINNCIFTSNLNSDIIGAYGSNIVLNNSIFSNFNSTRTPIVLDRCHLVMDNCTFENFAAKNGGVINFKGHYFSIKKSRFINSNATASGGAILAKYFTHFDNEGNYFPSDAMTIEDCEFINVSSLHDGGAIYIDLDSGAYVYSQKLNVINCTFTNCHSGFGGAIAQLGGVLNISNSKFINNSASHIGGAIYTSWCNLTLNGTDLFDNSAELNAGAIYFDNATLIIDHSNLTNNKVRAYSVNGNVVYANDVDAIIVDSIFNNGGAIYANFAKSSKLSNITSNDLFLLDNKDYVVSVENKGIQLNFVGNSLVVDKLPSKFDSRDWGWASPLKYQGDNLACWAFATVGAIECSLLKATGVLYNLSENNLQDLQLKYYSEGDVRNKVTGFAYSGLGYALSWYGVIAAQDDSYDERGMISDVSPTENRIHLQDAMIIFGGQNNTNELIKQAIMKYGSVSIQFVPTNFNYNYKNETENPTHFVALIGWDDNIPAEKFVDVDQPMPPGPGGWIIKDSEGSNIGDNGYDYLSYFDKSFLANDYKAIIPQAAAVAYIFENNIDYHVNYQTDLIGLAGFDGNYTYYSNEFISKYDELIGAVGTYFNESGINYSFDIYVNGVKVHTQNGVSEFAGFRTIVLSKYIPIKIGDKFKVVFKNNALPFQAFSRQHYMPGMTFVSKDGKSWEDITLKNRTASLKVYTVADNTKIIDNKNIEVDYDGGSYFSVRVVTADGRAVGAGAIVKFTINGKTLTIKTDGNGVAKIKITQLPKKYTITTNYRGQTVKNTVTVKQVLTASKVTVKKTAKKFVLQAKLKINGKLVKGKIIKFKFNGKTYKAKTNKKGIAKVTLKKKVIKKLKKGKKYTVKVTYLKDTIKTTVKVKR